MSRIKSAFENKKAYIGFLTAGDPSLAMTEEYIVEMARAGAALVEIGIPFSDPIAETATIQEANVRALSTETGCTTDMVFDMVASVSKKVDIPLVLLTYLNPVFKYGYDEFFKKCKETGVDGIIIPDMPYEEKGEVEPFANKYGVDISFPPSLISTESRRLPRRLRGIFIFWLLRRMWLITAILLTISERLLMRLRNILIHLLLLTAQSARWSRLLIIHQWQTELS